MARRDVRVRARLPRALEHDEHRGDIVARLADLDALVDQPPADRGEPALAYRDDMARKDSADEPRCSNCHAGSPPPRLSKQRTRARLEWAGETHERSATPTWMAVNEKAKRDVAHT